MNDNLQTEVTEKNSENNLFDIAKYESLFDIPMGVSESAWKQHRPFAFFLVEILKPNLLVELGVHTGGSLLAFCQTVQTMNMKTKIYGVDTWLGDKHSGLYDDSVYTELMKVLSENGFCEFTDLLRMKFDEAVDNFTAGSIDILHIDGLHTYEAVKSDFTQWLPKMSGNGVMVFHDTQVRKSDFGVWQFWDEISNQYPSIEFTHGYGLGVLAVGNFVKQEFLHFLAAARENNFYQKLFHTLGDYTSANNFSKTTEKIVNLNNSESGVTKTLVSESSSLLNNADSHVDQQNKKWYLNYYFQQKKTICLDLGCGICPKEGFVGIDNFEGIKAQTLTPESCDMDNLNIIQHDLSSGIPFDSNTITEIITSHYLEHNENLDYLFEEIYRVLKKKSKFEIIIPYANSAEGMYPGHNIFFTEKWFKNSLVFNKYFNIKEFIFYETDEYSKKKKKINKFFSFNEARVLLFNCCNQLQIISYKKDQEEMKNLQAKIHYKHVTLDGKVINLC